MARKRKAGRPRKPEGERYRTPQRSIRIPDDEWELIQQAAAITGESVSECIREAAWQWARKTVQNHKGGDR